MRKRSTQGAKTNQAQANSGNQGVASGANKGATTQKTRPMPEEQNSDPQSEENEENQQQISDALGNLSRQAGVNTNPSTETQQQPWRAPANAELSTLSSVVAENLAPVPNLKGIIDFLGDETSLLNQGASSSDSPSSSRRAAEEDELWLHSPSAEKTMMRELERANLRRIYEDEDDDDLVVQQNRNSPTANVMNSANSSGNQANSTLKWEHLNKWSNSSETRAVNILPASKSLVEPPQHNLIAIGRRPKSSLVESRQLAANAAGDAPLGWQASMSSLKERVAYLYNNDIHADVYFLVGKDEQRQRIPGHTFILWIGSNIFEAMFKGGLAPDSKDALEIELPDVEPSAFLTLLKYLYTDDVNIGAESVMTTLYTAKKYGVPALEMACIDFLKQNLGADNSFMLLSQARLFDERQLEQLCLEIIDKSTNDALNGEGFTEIDQETLCAVLSRDTLRVREASLFHAMVRWASEECRRKGLDVNPNNKREALGRALNLIRYPLMTVEEFAQGPAQSGLLSDRQALDLFLHFTVNPKPSSGFIDKPRAAIPGSENVVNRFQRIETRWGYNGTSDRIKFTVDRNIYIVGFGLFGSVNGAEEYEATIEIIHCGTGNTLAANSTSFVSDGSSSTSRVMFREPVHINPGVTYIASACLKGADTHYGTKGLRRIVHAPTGVTFQFTYAAVNNNGTSVEDGQIPEIIFHTKLS
ncbi:hypothetical protein WR25_19768 [Diploscapter pachys]|uniref:BTB domain-containing protein n=1 Tax=Diploscapter pachys TaxID=2018661 RepID=A0A2A2L8K6_9BILA|nr:hypothetical protein WR25_19768 [Diploscapter pachys]